MSGIIYNECYNDMVTESIVFFEDALFASIAAIGFSSISHTPRRAYFICGLAAAVGHSVRFVLMNSGGEPVNIIVASGIAAFFTGLVAVLFSPLIKVPAEACLIPGLLPMIPGMYAYRTVAAFAAILASSGEDAVMHHIYLLAFNGFTCVAIVVGLVIGGNLPVFMFKRISFQATR